MNNTTSTADLDMRDRLPEPAPPASDKGEAQPTPGPAEIPWIEWTGGECPLKNNEVKKYEIRYKSQFEDKRTTNPEYLNWSLNSLNPIIAYRVLKWRDADAVDWKAKCETAEAEITRLSRERDEQVEVAEAEATRAERAEAELARIVAAAHESGWNGVENSKDLAQFIKDQSTTLEERSRHIHPADHDRIVKGVQDRAKATIAEARLESLSQLRPIAEAGDVPEGCVRYCGYKNKADEWILGEGQDSRDTHFADIRLPAEPAAESLKDTYQFDGLPETPQPWTPKVGDVVKLRSGGPKMTVFGFGELVEATWFDGSQKVIGYFPVATLIPA